MSGDEYDPAIARLFDRAPAFPDAAVFVDQVEGRLERGGRMRTAALTAAGLIGGVFAVRETLASDFSLQASAAATASTSRPGGLVAAAQQGQTAVQSGLMEWGVNLDLASAGGMQLFWIGAGLLIAGGVMAAMRLAQEI